MYMYMQLLVAAAAGIAYARDTSTVTAAAARWSSPYARNYTSYVFLNLQLVCNVGIYSTVDRRSTNHRGRGVAIDDELLLPNVS